MQTGNIIANDKIFLFCFCFSHPKMQYMNWQITLYILSLTLSYRYSLLNWYDFKILDDKCVNFWISLRINFFSSLILNTIQLINTIYRYFTSFIENFRTYIYVLFNDRVVQKYSAIYFISSLKSILSLVFFYLFYYYLVLLFFFISR